MKKNKFTEPINQEQKSDCIIKLDEVVYAFGSHGEVPIFINAQFSEEIISIGYVFLATNEQNVVSVSNGRLQMMQGRMYYVPINVKNVSSDNYNIKIHSDAADRFDVRYVVDGLAAVVPIRHNCILKNGERLCILTPLT